MISVSTGAWVSASYFVASTSLVSGWRIPESVFQYGMT